MARALGLNEDLTEALCLAHDIGHPPFGHAGEDALQAAMAAAGGFDHNAHTIRLLTRLESPYPRFAGLNLSWETLEGLAKHNGPVADPPWALAEADADFPLELASWPGLEAQVAAIADDIAYDNHDIDDGLRAGLFTLEELLDVPLAARRLGGGPGALSRGRRGAAGARAGPRPDRPDGQRRPRRDAAPRRGLGSTSTAVRAAGRPLAGFSDGMAAEEQALKAFLHARMYDAPAVQAVRGEAQAILAALFAAYRDDPKLLPEEWRPASDDPVVVARAIGDFIAGMTDRYAVRRYRGADRAGRPARGFLRRRRGMASAGYSGTPLAKKLSLKDGQRAWFEDMPESVRAEIDAGGLALNLLEAPVGPIDAAHVFVTERAALEDAIRRLLPLLAPAGSALGVLAEKGLEGADRHHRGRDPRGRAPTGLVDVKVCAVDEIWSGLKLMIRKELRGRHQLTARSRSSSQVRIEPVMAEQEAGEEAVDQLVTKPRSSIRTRVPGPFRRQRDRPAAAERQLGIVDRAPEARSGASSTSRNAIASPPCHARRSAPPRRAAR